MPRRTLSFSPIYVLTPSASRSGPELGQTTKSMPTGGCHLASIWRDFSHLPRRPFFQTFPPNPRQTLPCHFPAECSNRGVSEKRNLAHLRLPARKSRPVHPNCVSDRRVPGPRPLETGRSNRRRETGHRLPPLGLRPSPDTLSGRSLAEGSK